MKWMFEHCEAAPTPLGGSTIAHSLIRPAHLAPCHDIRYYRCAFLNRLVRPIRHTMSLKVAIGASVRAHGA